jgi:ATP-dependent Clp protease ATP-binding subunit ClpC
VQTTIDLSTLLVVRELQSGECLVHPVADPELCSHGNEAACLLEQRLFLEQYLAAAPPEELARFSLPAGTELREVDVVIPRSDLPRRLNVETALAVPCIVIGRWVVVLPLRHTFYLEPKDDLDEAVRSEVVRMVGAEELTATDYLGLLPGRAHRLERLELSVERVERLPPGRAGSLRRKLAERQKRKAARAVLETVARPLHAPRGPAPPVVGRETELALLSTLLGGKDRLSVLLVGPESAGKGALLQAWTDAEAARSGREVWATSEAQLIAGMSGLGQWQERIRRVLEAAESIDAILAFDTLEDLFAERSLGVDFLGAIKPFLDERRVRIVGELREGALDRLRTRPSCRRRRRRRGRL